MAKANPIMSSFNGGELAPSLEGRVDLGKYASGCKIIENFIPMVQGPAKRRSGTRFVREVKNSANRTWLVRFEFSEEQAYILEFGNQYIRFYTNHGVVLSGGNPYEISTPYTTADLTNANGTIRLRMVQSADVIYIVHPNYPPKKLSRLGATNWTLTDVAFVGGPFEDIDPEETITVYSSAASGSVTITASSSIFQSSDVGTLFFIENKDAGGIKPWESQKAFDVNQNPFGERRRSDGKIYICTTNSAPPSGERYYTGSTRPTHTRGKYIDGFGRIEGTSADGPIGVEWEYESLDYGIVKITGYTSGTVVTGTVVKRLPFNVVGNTSTTRTPRWAFSRWSAARGWPSQVAFFRERLVFGTGQTIDMSVAADFENFADKNDEGEVASDMAISIEISSDQVNTIEWMAPSDKLIIGTVGGEFILGEVTTDEVLGPGNVKVSQQSVFGSRSVIPVQVGSVVLFVQRSGRKLRELKYDFSGDNYISTDLTVLSEHISAGGLTDIIYQQEPHSIVWCVRADGVLLGFTYNKEQEVLGWHRHLLGGNGVVECLETIPRPDGTQDDLWMIVRRTINGQTKRYIEYLEPDFTENSNIVDAFFVDSGLSYNGNNTTSKTVTITGSTYTPTDPLTIFFSASTLTAGNVDDVVVMTDSAGNKYRITITEYIAVNEAKGFVNKTLPAALRNTATTVWALAIRDVGGLSHLEGSTVQILTDGASHPDRVVSSGLVSLQVPSTIIHAGLGFDSKLKTMRIEAGGEAGTAQGKTKRINDITIRFLATLGAKAGPDENTLDEIQFRRGSDPMDAPPPVFTGDQSIDWPNGYDTDGYVTIVQEQPLPMTIVAIMPELVTND